MPPNNAHGPLWELQWAFGIFATLWTISWLFEPPRVLHALAAAWDGLARRMNDSSMRMW